MVESEKTGIFYVDPSMVDMIPITDIKPYKRNAKKHPQEQIDKIINSIKAFGMNDPIGVWGKSNIIVEGHGRYLALREMGESGNVPVIHLDNLTDEQRKAYALAHNKLTMNTDFDFDLLQMEMADLSAFFDMTDFGFLEFEEEEKPKEIVEDEIPIPPKEPKAKVGDVYQLGRHRLMCGDSTDMDGTKLTIHGSSNLRSSNSVEQITAETDPDLFDFNVAIIREFMKKYFTINHDVGEGRKIKPLRNDITKSIIKKIWR